MSKKDDLFLFTDITDDSFPAKEEAVTEETVTSEETPMIESAPPTTQPPVMEDTSVEEVTTPPAKETPAVAETSATEETPAKEDVQEAPAADMEEEFRSPTGDNAEEIVVPSFTGTADALTSAPKAKAPVPEEAPAAPSEPETSAQPAEQTVLPKKNPIMRMLGAIVPHVGDQAFDVVRKCVMIFGIVAFITAGVALLNVSVIQPIQYEQQVESLRHQYTPDAVPELTEEEQNYKYPEGIDPSFKKLYYQNNDIRGWITYKTTDNATFSIDYPIVQSADNDYYLFHDFNGTYNKNGVLFYDYRNDLSSPTSKNHNTIIYGHNMASGQMFAGLNTLLYSVQYARVAPTFTMNTIYNKAQYKVFAVMLVNNTSTEGIPFGYLRTEFNDNVEFASFLSEITARSLYVYGDVDVRPDDEIVTLSTCTDTDLAHFKDGRTVVVARKVREGEDPSTDVSQIVDNVDVIMPYAWYVNQKYEPHPYYTNPAYIIQPIDTLMDYLSTSTAPEGVSTTAFTLYTDANGTFGLIGSLATTVMTDANGRPINSAQAGQQMVAISVDSTPLNYYVGSPFDFARTKVTAWMADGSKKDLNPAFCAVTGFDSSKPGTCKVTVHYGNLTAAFSVNIYPLPDTPPEEDVNDTTSTKNTTVMTTTVTTTVATTSTSRSNNPSVLFPTRGTTTTTVAATTSTTYATGVQFPTTTTTSTTAPTTTTVTDPLVPPEEQQAP